MELLDFLLSGECPDARTERKTKDVEVKRLSKAFGEKAVFTLQSLSYDQLVRLRKLPLERRELAFLLDGVKSPSLKDGKLLRPEKGIVTQDDVVKALFSPGEITRLALDIEQLSGFDRDIVAEVKNA